MNTKKLVTLFVVLVSVLSMALPVLAGHPGPFPPPPPKPPAPPITRNCKPRGSCVLVCTRNEDGSQHGKWLWMSWAKWLKYSADHPDAFIYLGTFDTDFCAAYNGFLINVGVEWDGLSHVTVHAAPVTDTLHTADPAYIYTLVISDTGGN